MPLASKAEFKVYLNTTTAADDDAIDFVLDVATAQIERYCNRAFASATHTEDLSGAGDNKLVVRNPPVASITSLSRLYQDGTTSLVDAVSYTFDPGSGVIALNADAAWFPENWAGDNPQPGSPMTGYGRRPRFSMGMNRYRVVYVGGYSPIPADVKFACIDIAKDLFKNRRINRGMGAEDFGGGVKFTARASLDALDRVKHLLDPFRLATGMETV